MKSPYKNVFSIGAMICAGFAPVASMADDFIGGGTDGSDWTEAANWSPATVPGSTVDTLYFRNGTTIPALYTSAQGTTLVGNIAGTTGDFHVGHSSGGDGALTITGGEITVNDHWGIIIGQQCTGIMIIDGGTFKQTNAKGFRIGNSTNGVGTVSLISGTLTSSTNDLRLGANALLEISAGSATFAVSSIGTLDSTARINFTTNSSGSLTLTGATSSYYEGLFTSGNLTHGGSSSGAFFDHFNVTGSTLTSIPALVWDTVSDGASITAGNGTWDATTANWNNGTSSVVWGNTASTNALLSKSGGIYTVTIGADALSADQVIFAGTSLPILQGSYANLTANKVQVNTTGSGKLALNVAGSLSNVAAFSLGTEGSIYLTQGHIINAAVTLSGNGNTENRGALRVDDNSKVQGTISLTADSNFGSSSSTGYIESVVSGDYAFNQASTSPGTIVLSGDNTYTGGTSMTTGIVKAGHDHAFGTGLLQALGGKLSSDSTTDRTFNQPALIAGSVTLGDSTNTGKLTFTNTATINTATIQTDSDVEFQNIAGSGDLTKTGTGTLSLSGLASALTGNIQINQGALNLDSGLGLPDDLTIMPLGDSITYGYGGPGGYRLPLYNLLSPIASGFQFVGDSTEGSSDLPVNQKSHAGHSSYTSVDIKNNLNGLDSTRYLLHGEDHRDPHGGFWLTGGNGTGRAPLFPDVVLLLAGTNDVNILSGGIPEYVGYYTDLVTEITTLRPDTHVFLAKITPRSSFHQKTDDYNAAIQQVYHSFQTAGKNVYLVDLYTGYTGGWVDGVHPNSAGYNWMATQWYNALISNLGVPQNINISQVPTVTIGSGAAMTGQGKVNNLVLEGSVSPGSGIGSLTTTDTTITGAYLCDLNAESADSLVVEGNLTLTSATLTLNSLETASAIVYPVLTYTGTLTGAFTTVTGLPSGYSLVHDSTNKRFIIATDYAAWRTTNGLADEATVTSSDQDGDGSTDYLEFGTGGLPSDPLDKGTYQGGIHEVSGSDTLVFTLAVLSGATFSSAPDNAMTATIQGVTYRIESSLNLSDWNAVVAEVAPVTTGLPAAPAGYTYHSFRASAFPSSISRVFMRLVL